MGVDAVGVDIVKGDTFERIVALLTEAKANFRVIEHEAEGRSEKISVIRGNRPEQAAKASEMLGVRQIVPMHYGTFPALTGTPARLKELVSPRGVQVLELKPGDTTE